MASSAAPKPEAFIRYEKSPRTPNYYSILSVGKKATSKEIREAIAAKGPAAAQVDFVLFDLLLDAEIVLLDEKKRQIYDSVFDVTLWIHKIFDKGLVGDSNNPHTVDVVLAEFVAGIRKGTITEVPAHTYCALPQGFGEITERDMEALSGILRMRKNGFLRKGSLDLRQTLKIAVQQDPGVGHLLAQYGRQ